MIQNLLDQGFLELGTVITLQTNLFHNFFHSSRNGIEIMNLNLAVIHYFIARRYYRGNILFINNSLINIGNKEDEIMRPKSRMITYILLLIIQEYIFFQSLKSKIVAIYHIIFALGFVIIPFNFPR